jgi:hypothetical protein
MEHSRLQIPTNAKKKDNGSEYMLVKNPAALVKKNNRDVFLAIVLANCDCLIFWLKIFFVRKYKTIPDK